MQLYVRDVIWWRRHPFDTSANLSRRAFFESFVPPERILGPVFRQPLRNRGSDSGVFLPEVRSDEAAELLLATVIQAAPGGLDAADLKAVLGDYSHDLPESITTAFRRKPEWATEEGRGDLNPPGVLPGMVLAAVARAP